jgi:hypothetical protein
MAASERKPSLTVGYPSTVSQAMKHTPTSLSRIDWPDLLTILVASLGAGGFYLLKVLA